MEPGRGRPQPLVLLTAVLVGAVLTIAALQVFAGDDAPDDIAALTSTRASATTTVAQPSAPPGPAPAPVVKPPSPPPPPAAPKTPPVSVEKMIGQKIMVGFRGQATPPQALLNAIEAGRVGGVILFSENNGGPNGFLSVTKTLQAAAKRGHNPRLLISIDQEGGDVRRIGDAPPSLSPRQMGAQGAATSGRQGRATGEALAARRINVNLAPVVDVPSSSASFLGDRAFGMTAAIVSRTAGAFAQGVQAARVAATAKHYPGLGTTGALNTDTSIVTVRDSLDALSARATPFRRLAADGVRLVMVSNAIYTALDPSRPAVLSRPVVRGHLRTFFHGVVISDALEVPALKPYGSRVPVLASKAGVDVLLYTDTNAAGAYDAMLGAYHNGSLTRTRIKDSYERIIALKAWIAGR